MINWFNTLSSVCEDAYDIFYVLWCCLPNIVSEIPVKEIVRMILFNRILRFINEKKRPYLPYIIGSNTSTGILLYGTAPYFPKKKINESYLLWVSHVRTWTFESIFLDCRAYFEQHCSCLGHGKCLFLPAERILNNIVHVCDMETVDRKSVV